MQQFEMNRSMDQQELLFYLSDIKNGQEVLSTALSAQQTDINQMMYMMQNVRIPCKFPVMYLTASL